MQISLRSIHVHLYRVYFYHTQAVLASCAVPSMFQPVVVGGAQYVDGGIVDRTFVEGSRKWLRAVAPDVQQTVVSLITDVEGCAFGTRDGIRDLSGLAIVRTRRTKQSLVGRFEGTFVAEVDMAAAACAAVLGLAPS
ncbi:hypothetical protein T492DRAFT_960771 [Pavlovales sp. CCMP2436]|nr:hypothetical protein T492DRAFT_960771 [Pavlovales sp. CCMP2436]